MSRLMGRVGDVKLISDYLIENYNKEYKANKKDISNDELMDGTKVILTYLTPDIAKYINDCDVKIYYNKHIKGTIYSGNDEKENCIFFKTKKMKEEYKLDLMYFIGDLLRRNSLDYMENEFDIMCQYNDVLPLLIEYLYLKENNKEDIFLNKNINDLRENAKDYVKIYNKCQKNPIIYPSEYLLRNTLLFLVPLSSMDGVLQIADKYRDNKDEFVKLIKELFDNKEHNREQIMRDRNIDTYGFKRLRKEIER